MDIESLARGYTGACMKQLGGWATGEQVEDDLKFKAIALLLDRGWGRPRQPQEHAVKGEIKVTLRQMLEDDDG